MFEDHAEPDQESISKMGSSQNLAGMETAVYEDDLVSHASLQAPAGLPQRLELSRLIATTASRAGADGGRPRCSFGDGQDDEHPRGVTHRRLEDLVGEPPDVLDRGRTVGPAWSRSSRRTGWPGPPRREDARPRRPRAADSRRPLGAQARSRSSSVAHLLVGPR